MNQSHRIYSSPLSARYASKQMLELFSDDNKFSIWRKLWLALATSEKELGIAINDTQIAEMEAHLDDIDYVLVAEYESQLRHDVMAHIHAWGEKCPTAMPIIHLGATSCYVGDNTDLILIRDALRLIRQKMLPIISQLAKFADKYKALPTLGFTHFQPAQPVTVGKRATLWLQDLLYDLARLDFELERIPFLGSKGTTGTQASFFGLVDGDHNKVKLLDQMVASKMGFTNTVAVSGQTYSRKIDFNVTSVLSGIAQSGHKFANDIRLLQHLKEIEEPFETGQIGSSAMAYKRNPMRSERLTALARFVITNTQNTALTASEQWFERTLDDSANKRLVIPELFLATDAILRLYQNITAGLVVNEGVIKKHLDEELPFMATETILMEAVALGGNRQELHEHIRQHSFRAAEVVKQEGLANDLIERLKNDSAFDVLSDKWDKVLEQTQYTGRAAAQVDEFLTNEVAKILEEHDDISTTKETICV